MIEYNTNKCKVITFRNIKSVIFSYGMVWYFIRTKALLQRICSTLHTDILCPYHTSLITLNNNSNTLIEHLLLLFPLFLSVLLLPNGWNNDVLSDQSKSVLLSPLFILCCYLWLNTNLKILKNWFWKMVADTDHTDSGNLTSARYLGDSNFYSQSDLANSMSSSI